MGQNDPLAFLKQENLPIPKGAEGLDSGAIPAGAEDPLAFLKGSQSFHTELPATAPDRFLYGVGKGVAHPVNVMTHMPDVQEGDVAGKIGEFLGATASFAAILAATQGLAAPALASVGLTGTAARVGLNALAGAAFEAGAGDNISEAPGRALLGAAFAGGADLAFSGAASMLRKRFAGPTLNPLAMKFEAFMMPKGGDYREVLERLKALGSPEMQLDLTVAKLADLKRPDGMALIPDVKQHLPTLIPLLEKHFPDSHVLVHDEGNGIVNVLIAKKGLIERELPMQLGTLKPGFLAGGKPVMSNEDISTLIGSDNIALFIETQKVMKKTYGSGASPGLLGFARPTATPPEVHIGEDVNTPLGIFATMVHEYQHVLTRRLNKRQYGESFLGLFKLDQHRNAEDITHLMGIVNSNPNDLKGIAIELRDATYAAEQLMNRMVVGKGEELRTMQHVKGYIHQAWQRYYGQDTELISRLVELMALDPQKARQVAPRASRMMAKFILREEPKMRDILQQQGLSPITDILRQRWYKDVGEEGMALLSKQPFELDAARQAQFKATGFFNGMTGFVNGREVILDTMSDAGAKVRDVASGKMMDVAANDFQRPFFPTLIKSDAETAARVAAISKQQPNWLSMYVEDGQGVRPITVDMEGYEQVTDLRKWVRDNRVYNNPNDRQALASIIDGMDEQGIKLYTSLEMQAGRLPTKGIIWMQDGMAPSIFVPDTSKLMMAPFSESKAFLAGRVSGKLGEQWLTPSFDDVSRSLLRQAGVIERDLPYWQKLVMNDYRNQAMQLLEPETRQIVENAAVSASKISDSLAQAAERVGLKLEYKNGVPQIVSPDDHVVAAALRDDGEVVSYLNKVGIDESLPALDASVASGSVPPQIPTEIAPASAGGNGRPPLFQEQMTDTAPGFWLRLKRSLANMASWGVAMENWLKNAENLGHGPAYSRIYLPVKGALDKVAFDLSKVKRDELGGRSYDEAIHQLSKMLVGIPRKRQPAIIDYIEAMSRSEVEAAGGLLKRDMDANEIRIADALKQMRDKNMIRDVPWLMTMHRLGKIAVEQGEAGLERAQAMAGRYAKSPEKIALYSRMASEAPKTLDEAYQLMGITDSERAVLKLLNDAYGEGKGKFSIYAITRWMSAFDLKPGFKTGREQIASELGLTAYEMEIARNIDAIMQATFKQGGLDPKSAIGGYWPHLRDWIQHGNTIEDIPGLNELPEELQWSSLRVRTGELDVYNKDPLLTTFKHVRSMLMKQHFDPILPELNKARMEIKYSDPRTFRVVDEYIAEAMGKPHESFNHIEQAIQGSAAALGIKLPERLAEHTINTLVTLASAAAIPFRPALIARNYFQMLQMVAPRTGMSYFVRALKFCVEPATRDEAFELAVKAGAVPVDRLPIHAGTEILGPRMSFIPFHTQAILKKGFGWYQSADDLGRAVAFYAQRMRVADALPDYMEGRIGLEAFLQRAKVRTFDPQDQKIFLDLMKQGSYEDAKNHLGNVLQREAIFRYGQANHPAGWGSAAGRLFGQFGTWPVQYKDFLIQGLTRGTVKDRIEFAAIHGAINVGVIAAGIPIGLNLWSWVSFPSLAYNGGPFADMAVNMYQAMGGSPSERSMALRNLKRQMPTLDDPRSIFLPGSYLLGDIKDAYDNGNPGQVLGFKFYKPGQKTHLEWLMGD